MTLIVDSLIDSNIFFIFRDDLTEVKCYFDSNNVIRPEKHRLTKEEIIDIDKKYRSKNIVENYSISKK